MVDNCGGCCVVNLTWYHVTEPDCAERDEGVVEAVVEVPGPRLIILQRREDGGGDEHQDRRAGST